MMPPETIAIINIVASLLIVGVSIPLVLRKITMNHFYGIRFPQSFKSNEAWYEINEYGGKALIVSMLPNIGYGIYGVIYQPSSYNMVSLLLIVGSLSLACLVSFVKARKFTA